MTNDSTNISKPTSSEGVTCNSGRVIVTILPRPVSWWTKLHNPDHTTGPVPVGGTYSAPVGVTIGTSFGTIVAPKRGEATITSSLEDGTTRDYDVNAPQYTQDIGRARFEIHWDHHPTLPSVASTDNRECQKDIDGQVMDEAHEHDAGASAVRAERTLTK